MGTDPEIHSQRLGRARRTQEKKGRKDSMNEIGQEHHENQPTESTKHGL